CTTRPTRTFRACRPVRRTPPARRPRRRSDSILPFVLLTMTTLQPDTLGPGDHTHTLTVDGRKRTYLVHVPKSSGGKKPWPVVLAYHGGGSNAEQMVRFCGLSDKADQAGFLVVYPNGTGQTAAALSWNGGNCCAYAMQNQV